MAEDSELKEVIDRLELIEKELKKLAMLAGLTKPWLSVEEAALYIASTPGTVYNDISNAVFKEIKGPIGEFKYCGRRPLFSRERLDRWIMEGGRTKNKSKEKENHWGVPMARRRGRVRIPDRIK